MKGWIQDTINNRAAMAESRFGAFASSHEALGVALEEWNELQSAIKANNRSEIISEALDLAAVLVRLADALNSNPDTQQRSKK